ncbi:MAG TPA: type II secretion system F family protein [Acidimicrobiales bacterium]|jgi:tight adherence protein B|nr:type II secretion system F family protein [Acidimicrobiales bacterium]
MSAAVVAVLIGFGVAFVVVGVLLRGRERDQALADILDLPFGERDVPVEAVSESGGLLRAGAVGVAGRMVGHLDAKGSLALALERARIPLKPGEYVIVVGVGAAVAAALLGVITASVVLGIGALAGAVAAGALVPRVKIARRRQAFEAQLPEALSLIASSLSAGHTFLRAIQMMTEEAEDPIAEEFGRVVSETRLGDPVVDALERMALRLDVQDLRWVVQAIRVQQTVGGKLADILHTLADFIRSREEVRREVKVLTAEGRMSAWVLGALPLALLLAIQVLNPGYAAPLYEGWGLLVLVMTGLSVLTGVAVILRMVKIEV